MNVVQAITLVFFRDDFRRSQPEAMTGGEVCSLANTSLNGTIWDVKEGFRLLWMCVR